MFAEMTVTAVQFWFVRGNFKLKDILIGSKKYIIASLVMFVSCLFIGQFLEVNIKSLFIEVGLGIIVYVAMLIILKDEFFRSILNKIKDKVR